MALTTSQQRELDRIKAEITRCEMIRDVTDGLGSSHSDLGQTTTYSDGQIRRALSSLPGLIARRDQLEAIDSGERTINPYVNRGVLR